jgi:excisionase family DNA binding protein
VLATTGIGERASPHASADSPPLATPRTAPVRRRFELPEDLLTVAEVAAVLKVCTATVYKMVKAGVLPSVRIVNSVRLERAAVAKFLRPSDRTEQAEDDPCAGRATE